MTRVQRLPLVLGVFILLVVSDHVTKWMAIRWLKDTGSVYAYFWDMFRLQYAENTGAFLSLGAGLPDGWRAAIMIGLNSVILGGVLVYLLATPRLDVMSVLAFVCIAGGGVGNLIDRVFRDGRVVDFMNMGVWWGEWTLRTGIFNIADIAIMAGLFLVIVCEVQKTFAASKRKHRPPRKSG